MLCITIDIDWAPDPIVESILDFLEKKNVPATLFCTDPRTDASGASSTRPLAGRDGFEIGLHPNFVGQSDYERVLRTAKEVFPDARGIRSHNGLSGWPIAAAAARLGIKYEVSCTVFPTYVPPFYANEILIDYVMLGTSFWDSQAFFVDGFGWRPEDLWFWPSAGNPERIFVIGFHPTILFYDMRGQSEYEAMKKSYHRPDLTRGWAGKRENLQGAMKLLTGLVERAPKEQFTTIGAFLKAHPARRQSELLRSVEGRARG